jgi:hypothetical protein
MTAQFFRRLPLGGSAGRPGKIVCQSSAFGEDAVEQLSKLLERWDSGEGKPYKGSLIDWDAYEADKQNIGCMCAQGQVLHLLGGWTPDRLSKTEQEKADKATAKLLNISIAHSILLRSINDKADGAPSVVLTNPEKILGDQARVVLAFWLHLDGMKAKDWKKAAAAGAAARAAAWAAAWAAARAAAYACSEIQGARIMREKGQAFFFLPMFSFADPESIPPLPADYGVSA